MRKITTTLFLFVLACWGFTAVGQTPVNAARSQSTLTVCPVGCDYTSIQAAVNAANNGDLIHISMLSALTESDIIINKDITIEGLDQNQTIVQAAAIPGTAAARVFTIMGVVDVEIRDLTIRHGRTTTGSGGGIWVSNGQVSLNRVIVSQNEATYGGGISNQGSLTLNETSITENIGGSFGGGLFNNGTLNVIGGEIDHNHGGTGGGLYNQGTATLNYVDIRYNVLQNYSSPCGGGITNTFILNIQNSWVRYNDSGSYFQPPSNFASGGGICTFAGTTTLNNVIFNTNQAVIGGGLYLDGGDITGSKTTISTNIAEGAGGIRITDGTLTLERSAIVNNIANSGGSAGGISQTGGIAYLTNVTISNNRAHGHGGGISYSDGEMILANVTVADNLANSDSIGNEKGGGIYVAGNNLRLRSSIIADNQVGTGSTHQDCYGTFASASYSLIGNLGPIFELCSWSGFSIGMLSGINAELGPLEGDYHEQIHPLLSNSPAIDAGRCVSATGPVPLSDQRGYAMPVDGDGDMDEKCDMGAYEYGSMPLMFYIYLPAIGTE